MSGALSASVLCLIPCLTLPVLLTWSPWLNRSFDLRFDAHLWIVLIVGPVSASLLYKAARRRHFAICGAGVAGLGCLVLALLLPAPERLQIAMSTVGSLLLAGAHAANWLTRHRHSQPCTRRLGQNLDEIQDAAR